MGVRFCSIAEPNRTIGVRLGSIVFLFGFVRLDRSGDMEGASSSTGECIAQFFFQSFLLFVETEFINV